MNIPQNCLSTSHLMVTFIYASGRGDIKDNKKAKVLTKAGESKDMNDFVLKISFPLQIGSKINSLFLSLSLFLIVISYAEGR